MKFHEVDIRGSFKLPIESNSSLRWDANEIGKMFYSIADNGIFFGDASGYTKLNGYLDVFQTNTSAIMGSYPIPTGWNILSSYVGRCIYITGIPGEVGITDGSWTIWGLSTAGQHDHTLSPAVEDRPVGKSDIYGDCSKDTHIHTMTADGLHTHTFDGNWRPAWKKFIAVRYVKT